MIVSKSDPDAIQSYLTDASNMRGGSTDSVLFPETTEDVAEILAGASRSRTPVTISGAGTGTVGGRIPQGGLVIATDKLRRIIEIVKEPSAAYASVQAGVVLADFQKTVEAQHLLYPPDPTERSCYLGATVATNSSGARTFKYGPTRNYVRRLLVVMADGDTLNLRRGEVCADHKGFLRLPLSSGRVIEAQLPSYRMPATRKHAAGYYIAKGMDAIDLFIGSEGTLGVITEVEVELLPEPEGLLSGVVFFAAERDLLAFVRAARELSLRTRELKTEATIDARALEYFDSESLSFLRNRYNEIPSAACGAIFFEQELKESDEEKLLDSWFALVEEHQALVEDSWFATDKKDAARIREFRHQLPVMVNEWLLRHGQRKVSTDLAVPDESFAEMLGFYQQTLRGSQLQYVIFGHIGDNHVHVNIMPRDDAEAARAREIYLHFVRRAVKLGGTISAEHGVGKIKREYLRELYGETHLREMAALKRTFDPACLLGRGNIFAAEYLDAAQ